MIFRVPKHHTLKTLVADRFGASDSYLESTRFDFRLRTFVFPDLYRP